MQLSIILLNYNKSYLTLVCLESLYAQYHKKFEEGSFEVIVVDNGSQTDELRKLSEGIKMNKYKSIKLVRNNNNLGFSKGCNIGAKSAGGDLYLFLNNDTIVNEKGIVDMTEYLIKHQEVGILGGQLKNLNGSDQPSVGKFYNLFYALIYLLGMQKHGLIDKNPSVVSEVDWVKGGFLMVRKNVFDKLSGFDEEIFMYTEDMEFCYRAKQAGFKTFFYPNTSIFHREHGSTNRSFAIIHIYKGILYFYKKHKSEFEYKIVKGLLITKAWIAIITGTVTRNNYLTSTYKRAIQF